MTLPANWNPDHPKHWQQNSAEAYRYLWSASGILASGFAVWMQWSVWVVYMPLFGHVFSLEQLFSLLAIAGLGGALFRIPATFVSLSLSSRSCLLFIVYLLLVPVLGTAYALEHPHTSLLAFQGLALLSGLGGAVFSVSMARVSVLFPQRQQGLALGLHAGLGNLGVVAAQIILPLMVILQLQYLNLFFVAGVFIALTFLFYRLTRIFPDQTSLSVRDHMSALFRLSLMLVVTAVIVALSLYLILSSSANGAGLNLAKEWVLVGALILTLWSVKSMPKQDADLAVGISAQFRIFNNKHTWLMAVMYVMSFGTFIGFASAFPLLSHYVFGFSHSTSSTDIFMAVNPNEPSMIMYWWFGPLLAIVSRPLGGWLGDRYGGSRVTFWCAALMGVSSIWLGQIIASALQQNSPEALFVPFLLAFMLLFIGSGLANGSSYRTLSELFPKQQRQAVIGWVSAMGACGAFYIPLVMGESLQSNSPISAFIGLAVFYFVCMALGRLFYLDKNADHYNP